MRNVYLDASVLLRAVLGEPGRLPGWDALDEPVTSALSEVEGLRTIDRAARKATHPRRRPLGDDEASAARARLHQLLQSCAVVALEAPLVSRAGQLAGPLGTLDALHLATALAWAEHSGEPCVMATHDPELGAAALAHGLQVIGLPRR